MSNQSCMRCYISGTVQGVWYRASAKIEADKLGVKGWAKNLNDGTVEVYACGSNEILQRFYYWLEQGPRLAKVENVIREDVPWQDLDGFEVF